MADGDISDASPPRRRRGNDIQNIASLDDNASHATKARDELLDRQSSHVRHFSSRQHHRDFGSEDTTGRAHEHIPAVKRLSDQGEGDVRDASPPRRRRRKHMSNPEIFAKIKTSDETNPARNAIQARHRPGRKEILTEQIKADENVSVRSSVPAGRRQGLEHSQLGYNQTVRAHRAVNAVRAPRNRFGIQPGPRWDGVNRTNGFEERLEAMKSMRKDIEIAGYRASVSDL